MNRWLAFGCRTLLVQLSQRGVLGDRALLVLLNLLTVAAENYYQHAEHYFRQMYSEER